MKLVVGLGNPGGRYKNNRHNVGQMFVDKVSKIQNTRYKTVKTDCFMNESGRFVKQELKKLGIKEFSQVYIVHDDLDIPLGQYKIQLGVGPKVHYGVNSIEESLGTADFWRIRIGVDNRNPASRESGDSYVLKDFLPEEREILDEVFDEIIGSNPF